MAAEGIAGLVLSAVSIAALFDTCVNCLNIVVSAREFGRDYELLCTELALQKLRLFLWGESVGLASRHGTPGPYNPGLDDPVLKSTIVQTLQSIEFLLTETKKYDERYGLKKEETGNTRAQHALNIFNSTFDRFTEQSRRNQKQKSVLAVTKWAIFAADQFDAKIARLRNFIDGLENVTKSLGVLELQHLLMRDEIGSIQDVESLELLSSSSSVYDVSYAASQRLLEFEHESRQPPEPTVGTGTSIDSFHTAPSRLEQLAHSCPTLDECETMLNNFAKKKSKPSNQQVMTLYRTKRASKISQYIPVVAPSQYGQLLAAIRIEDQATWDAMLDQGIRVPSGSLSLKRILRDVAPGKDYAPWISIAPFSSDITKQLASIEGPPGTPYENGIFWLYFEYTEHYPQKPPYVRFVTRLYHPNIDSRGKICLNILGNRWCPVYDSAHVLVSICSMLNEPVVDDPLVPEIAQTYIEDYDLYCQNARTYTRKYATGERPDVSNL